MMSHVDVESLADVLFHPLQVMPVLLQGLDALSKRLSQMSGSYYWRDAWGFRENLVRHVDKVATGTTMGSSKQKFNPLIWPGAFGLRNRCSECVLPVLTRSARTSFAACGSFCLLT